LPGFGFAFFGRAFGFAFFGRAFGLAFFGRAFGFAFFGRAFGLDRPGAFFRPLEVLALAFLFVFFLGIPVDLWNIIFRDMIDCIEIAFHHTVIKKM